MNQMFNLNKFVQKHKDSGNSQYLNEICHYKEEIKAKTIQANHYKELYQMQCEVKKKLEINY